VRKRRERLRLADQRAEVETDAAALRLEIDAKPGLALRQRREER
jgi:hypothetical protein